MKPFFEQINTEPYRSFRVQRYVQADIDIPWHFHPEHEIVWVVKGQGQVFVKDHVMPYSAHELVLVGSNVPHFYSAEQATGELLEILVIQFSPELFHHHLLAIPEMQDIQGLLARINHGIKIEQAHLSKALALQLSQLEKQRGVHQLTALLEVLDAIAQVEDYQLISESAESLEEPQKPPRLQRIIHFILENYQRNIRLAEVADIAHLEKSAFCRYFKKHTRVTFNDYVNTLRINFACKLLSNSDLPITQIAYSVGYNHFSHFVREFKKREHMLPKAYRQAQMH